MARQSSGEEDWWSEDVKKRIKKKKGIGRVVN